MYKFSTLFLLSLLFSSFQLNAQVKVYHQGIAQTNVNFRGGPVTLAQQDITTSEAGTVVVRFDGYGLVDIGDRLIVAASNTADWGVNSGNVGLEAYNSDQNRRPFSHTRTYTVGAGNHSFYAVGENWVEQDGSGVASVYGSLTVKFYPNSGTMAKVASVEIEQSGVNVRAATTSLASLDINAPIAGTVVLNFDGSCISSPGDRILLAANEAVAWQSNNGQCSVEAYDNDLNASSFSHSRAYPVSAGTHTFYAVAQNYVETAGTGDISVYGNFTAEFFPDTIGDASSQMAPIVSTNTAMRGAPISLNSLSFDVPAAGKVLVHFNGYGIPDVGDRMILAASNQADWSVNDGQVGIEAVDGDLNRMAFSHSRMYDVTPGTQTFYAVAENYVETEGSGSGSVYANLTYQYFPNTVTTDIEDLETRNLFESVVLSPNPSNGLFKLSLSGVAKRDFNVQIRDTQGRMIQQSTLAAGPNAQLELDLRYLPAGIYFLSLNDGQGMLSRKIIIE
ncbi:MAG: T9SS type A sorting domain-containing protein [Bacteroidota bacterium]